MDPSLHIYTYNDVLRKLRSFLKKAKKPLIIIGGPTASGKTKLAVTLCALFNGEVISADSRQLYSEMEIGNERTKPEEMEGIPHHCIAITKPSDTITAAEFKRIAEKTIDKIRKKGCIPFLVGGTGLYINTIVKNFQIPVMNTDSSLRKKLSLLPMDRLLKMLKTVDPEEYEKQKVQKNKRFIIRALEIHEITGKPKSKIATTAKPKYESFQIAIEWPRETLYERINARTVRQVETGMVEEVMALIKKYSPDLPAMSSIGCKEVIPYLEGKLSKAEMIRTLQQNNRHFAKRQLTWFKKDPEYHWIEGTSVPFLR